METPTVANATHTDSGTPATFRATRRTGTAAPSRGRGAWTAPEHLTRITEAAAVAAVEAFYGPETRAAARPSAAASQVSHIVR